jgi:hypothetical protein
MPDLSALSEFADKRRHNLTGKLEHAQVLDAWLQREQQIDVQVDTNDVLERSLEAIDDRLSRPDLETEGIRIGRGTDEHRRDDVELTRRRMKVLGVPVEELVQEG